MRQRLHLFIPNSISNPLPAQSSDTQRNDHRRQHVVGTNVKADPLQVNSNLESWSPTCSTVANQEELQQEMRCVKIHCNKRGLLGTVPGEGAAAYEQR
jgi:hypothetical protein